MTGPQMVRKLKGICVVGAFDQYAVVIGGKDLNGMLSWHYFFFPFPDHVFDREHYFICGQRISFLSGK